MIDVSELVEAIDLTMPPAHGRRASDVTCEVLRPIRPEDLPALATSVVTPRQQIERCSAQHHRIARLMAQGRTGVELSALTGYSAAYLSSLKSDPCFAELVAGYSAQADAIFVDVMERMKALGLTTIEELQKRLDEKPDDWTRRELMELAELTLRSEVGAKPGPGQGGSAPLNINVKFVSAAIQSTGGMEVIEGEVVR